MESADEVGNASDGLGETKDSDSVGLSAGGAFKVGGFPSGGPEVVMGLCVESVAEVGKASDGVGTMDDSDAGDF